MTIMLFIGVLQSCFRIWYYGHTNCEKLIHNFACLKARRNRNAVPVKELLPVRRSA